jgi:hypothetical protein
LGAHLVGPHAEEVINLFGVAIRRGPITKDLQTTMFAYPTGASDIGYMLYRLVLRSRKFGELRLHVQSPEACGSALGIDPIDLDRNISEHRS